MSNHLQYCNEYKKYKCETFSKEYLIKEYCEKERSAIDIANEHGFISSTIIDRLLKKFNIEKRNISQSKLTQFVRDKYKSTNLSKYGSPHNFCKNHPSRKEWEKRLLDEEGIINIFQRKEVVNKIAEKLANYKSDPRVGSRISNIHRSINEFIINELNISTKLEYKIDKYFYDIFVEPNFILEINGDLFHANPIKYKSGDLLSNHIFSNKLVDDIWVRDEIKNKCAIEAGYQLLVIWENDIKKNIDGVRNKIKLFLNGEFI